jgi:hypothetical protein
VVKGMRNPQNGSRAAAKLYDFSGVARFSREATVDATADGVRKSIAIPEPAGISTAYFYAQRAPSARNL